MSVVVSACACAPPKQPWTDAEYGMHIDTDTPRGVRARQFMDMVNSEWPIGIDTVATLATQEIVKTLSGSMDQLWADRPLTITALQSGVDETTLRLRNSYGVSQDVALRINGDGMVDRYQATLVEPEIEQWSDIGAELGRSGARYSFQASKVTDGVCTNVAGANIDESLPMASIFKLYVLLAVANAVTEGRLTWNERLEITEQAKEVGSSGFDHLPPGSNVSVREAAEQMIWTSDNMATDLLIARVGRDGVHRALVAAGHHDPASLTPFPTTHELFAIGWGKPDVREEWRDAAPERRAQMLAHTNTVAFEPDPERVRAPASPYGIEWYGTAMDVCRVHAALQRAATGPAAPVHDILSAIPGIGLDRSAWPYIGAKGGNLPGDLTFSWFAADNTGQGWVVSFQLNWPKYRGQTAATWLLSIATQTFGLISAGTPTR